MAKIYSKKAVLNANVKPKKETISFLLNYSKALSYLKVGSFKIETFAN